MTHTFNPESYTKLIAQYQPKTITTEEGLKRAIALVATELEHRTCRTPEENTLLELLVTLIEKFEETHYPVPQGTPYSMLQHLMDARELAPQALIEVIGSKQAVFEIINGTRIISKAQAQALADFFKVHISLFL